MDENVGQFERVLHFCTGKQRCERFLHSFERNPTYMKTVSKEMVILSITIGIDFPYDRNIDSKLLAICQHEAVLMDGCKL